MTTRKTIDLHSPHGDARRSRRHAIILSGVAGAGSRFFAILATIVTVPLAKRSLTINEFGLWLLAASLFALLSTADFGVGNSLVSATARLLVVNPHEIRRAAAEAVAALARVGILGFAVSIVCVLTLPVDRLLGLHLPMEQLRWALLIISGSCAACLPLSVAAGIRRGFQQGQLVGIWAITGAVAQVLLSVALWSLKAGLLFWISAAVLAPLVMNLGLFWGLVQEKRFRGLGAMAYRSPLLESVHVLARGGMFTIIALSGALAYQTDAFIIGHFYGSVGIARYSLPLRLYSLIPTAASFILMPLWPAYSDAHARRDDVWIRRTLKRSLVITLLGNSLLAAMVSWGATYLLRIWVGPVVTLDASLQWALVVFVVSTAVTGPISVFLNGLGVIRLQAVFGAIMAMINFPLSILWAREYGIAGPLWATNVTQVLVVILPSAVLAWRVLARNRLLSGTTL